MSDLLAPRRMVELEVDGQPVRVFEGSTILDACARLGIDTPTLCYGETLEPANVCRVCVVEVEGARVLAPACSRKVEPGMKVRTDSIQSLNELVSELTATELKHKLDTGVVTGGMAIKAAAILRALAGGVRAVHLIDGRAPHNVIAELFTDTGVGTVVRPDGPR